MLGDLTDTAAKRIAEYRRRRRPYFEQSFAPEEREDLLAQGWELIRANKTVDRLRKIREVDEQLENEFWKLLYEFGYPRLSIGREFSIVINSKTLGSVSHKIDILAYDSETIVIAKCIALDRRAKPQLQKDIADLSNLKRPIADALRRHFGGPFSQKLLWLFVTRNVEWSDADLGRVREANIHVLGEREMFYYKEVAKRIGHSARFQFHAEFFAKKKVSTLDSVDVFALKTKLGRHRVFSFFAPAAKILPIAFVNHRDLKDPTAAPSYQRLIQRQRLKQIAEFLSNGGFFANAIILNFKQKVRFEPLKPEDSDGVSAGALTFPNNYKSAWIIDGQHRIYGYAELEQYDDAPLLPFIAFENIKIAEETKLFSDINSKQKRVEKKLLDEIAGEIKLDSADKREQIRAIASRAFDLMRDDEDGPLGGKITGVEIKQSEHSVLTIPYLVDAVVSAGLLGRIHQKDGQSSYQPGFIYWNDATDAIEYLAVFLTEYFNIFRYANIDRWELGKAGKFASNPGVSALIRLSGDVLAYLLQQNPSKPGPFHPKVLVEKIEEYVRPVATYFESAPDEELEQRFQIPFGSGGPRVFQHRLRELIGSEFCTFDPPGYRDDLRKYDAARTRSADQKVRDIQEFVHHHVLEVLKREYGADGDYLEKGVTNREILKKAYEKRLEADEGDRKDIGTYLDFLDLMKIVDNPKNWPHFSKTLNIRLPGENKGKARNVSWFGEVNKTRRISAHPYNRGYSDEEVSILDHVHRELTTRGVILKEDA